MKKQLYKVNKGLVEKVLDLYFKYCELRLPFKIDDAYEKHEFSLEFVPKAGIGMHEYYNYYKKIDTNLDEFKVYNVKLHFYWDELIDFEIVFEAIDKRRTTKSIKEVSNEVLNLEILVIKESSELIKLNYTSNTESLELTVNEK